MQRHLQIVPAQDPPPTGAEARARETWQGSEKRRLDRRIAELQAALKAEALAHAKTRRTLNHMAQNLRRLRGESGQGVRAGAHLMALGMGVL